MLESNVSYNLRYVLGTCPAPKTTPSLAFCALEADTMLGSAIELLALSPKGAVLAALRMHTVDSLHLIC